MDVVELNPNDLQIDPLNERNENVGPHKNNDSLEDSIERQGLIQPPIVRTANGGYKVIVGQRRTLAAQAVGLERIPVIVVDWDDSEALQATITENADVFQKRVAKADRAAAIDRLIELTGWNIQELSEKLGVSRSTIDDWIERTRDAWEETSVHVDSAKDNYNQTSASVETHDTGPSDVSLEDVEKISDTDLRAIRTSTDSPEERQEVVKQVVQSGLTQRQIREAKKRSQRGGTSLVQEIERISKESQKTEGEIRVRTEVTFTGEYAEGLQKAARDAGSSEEDIVRRAIEHYLIDEGYL